MYLNRITFSLDKNHFNDGILIQFNDEQIKRFNQVTNLFEEILRYHLPRNTNLGGFGYFNNNLVNDKNKISLYPPGQCIEFYHYLDIDRLNDFVNSSSDIQLIKLSELLKSAITEISKVHFVVIQLGICANDGLVFSKCPAFTNTKNDILD